MMYSLSSESIMNRERYVVGVFIRGNYDVPGKGYKEIVCFKQEK